MPVQRAISDYWGIIVNVVTVTSTIGQQPVPAPLFLLKSLAISIGIQQFSWTSVLPSWNIAV